MEKLRRIQQEESLPEVGRPTRGPEGSGAAGAPATSAGVTVIWGPYAEDMGVQGMTVGAVYRLLRVPFNLATGVNALVNGRLVEPDHRLADGESLEFTRPAAEKGAVT